MTTKEQKQKRADYMRAWRKANRERCLAEARARREKNREKTCVLDRKYYAANAAQRRARNRNAYAARRAENPEKMKAYKRELGAKQRKDAPEMVRAWKRKHRYGITEEEFQRMLTAQAGLCWICGCLLEANVNADRRSQRRCCVDHDHETNKVRGLLCVTCNSGIGSLKESPALMKRAAEYVARFSSEQEGIKQS